MAEDIKIKEAIAKIIISEYNKKPKNGDLYIYAAWLRKEIKSQHDINSSWVYIHKLLQQWSKINRIRPPLIDLKKENEELTLMKERSPLDALFKNVRGYKVNNFSFFRNIIKIENLSRRNKGINHWKQKENC